MGLFTLSMNKQKYSKSISIYKALRSKQATINCSIKKADKQENIKQQHCKDKAKTFYFKCIQWTILVCDIKDSGWRNNSVSFV